VLIAGPSSSGKTTFSRRLAVQLLALGLSPYALNWTITLPSGSTRPGIRAGRSIRDH